MKKSKIFLATGALILAASAIFATKANKKFIPVATGYASGSAGVYAVKASNNILTTTGKASEGRLYLKISGSEIATVVTGSNGTSGLPVYFN